MMLSPRRPYVAPQMQIARFDNGALQDRGDFEGLSPAEAAKLFNELIKAHA